MKPSDQLGDHFRIDEAHKKALERLDIKTVLDLLYHLPTRYEDISEVTSIAGLKKGQEAIVFGRIGGLKSRRAWKSKKPIAEGWVEDGSGRIKLMWFNQPYIAKMLENGIDVKLTGTVTGSEEKPYIANPEVERSSSLPIDTHDSIFKAAAKKEESIYPVYRETKGVTSKWFYHTAQKCFNKGALEKIVDPLPKMIRKRYNLPELATALQWIHIPRKKSHTESARKRFAFEEVFYIQVQKALERREVNAASCYQFKTDNEHAQAFIDRFSFELTASQKKAIHTILTDFNGSHAMSRLLEGDVGSGKTAVAATTAYAVATSRPPEGLDKKLEFGNLQVAYMAPTEILARQHFESFIEYFHHLPIQIGLITGSGCMKFPSKVDATKPTKISRAQLLKWVKNGEIPILIGTHALIYKSVEFKHLAHVIIDEQHRFGTSQRRALAKKDQRMPHLLSMTATPIPRTLALTIYGDLDITLLTEMPKGRKPIITELVTKKDETEKMYEHIESELKNGRQAFVICPRIEEPDESKANALRLKSVKEEAKRLKEKVFKDRTIDILHSKMKPAEKEATMKRFADGEIDILVATSVVEVGVNVPNATNIIIEGAERFGLSQLHQLRGRVQRSSYQSYCFAVTKSASAKTRERLKALKTAKNGFELAEYDLAFRGSGELYGQKQSGLTDLGMEAIKNIKLVEAAREEARALVDKDSTLHKHPEIHTKVSTLGESLHME
jgi:ATP-dependent DNA helicase RecG